jgi:phosphinothricin acetyltransferase
MDAGPVIVRHGTRADLTAINEIYNHYVRETTVTFDLEDWDMARREAWFAAFAMTGRHQLVVAEEDGNVTGFACSRPYYPKAAYDTTVETTIVLAPGLQRRGLGRRLYECLFSLLAGKDVHRYVAAITATNVESIAFHEAMGFTRLGTFHEVGRKFGRYWDVAWYERPNRRA